MVDALSRSLEDVESSVNAIFIVKPTWMHQIIQSYEHDPVTSQLITELITDPNCKPKFSLHQGVIRYEQKIYVGRASALRNQIFEELHRSLLRGHSGLLATYKRVKILLYWPNMKMDICKWVSECDIFQRVEIESPRLLQSLLVPEVPWHDIAMDFVEGLPSSGQKNTILVVVDRLTKYGHFLPLKHPYTAQDIINILLREIYKLHGLLKIIVTTRDPVFTSQFWKQLFKAMGTKLNITIAYHPQSDGQMETLNRCLESYPHVMVVFSNPKQWVQ